MLMNKNYNFFPYTPKSNLASLQTEKKRKRESDISQTSPNLSSSGSPFITNISNSGSPFINGTPIMSETTTESEIDEYISINGNQVVRIIDADSKEAEDVITKRRFFVGEGQLLYKEKSWHAHSLKTSVELAVCGGNIYALLMGDGQPEYFIGKGEVDEDLDDDIETTYYRVSSKINFLAEGEDIFSLNKSVKGLIFSLMISYFLGDPDVSNVVGVEEDECLLVRRLDPELCFSSYFTAENHNNYDSVLTELKFLYRLNADNEELTKKELQDLIEKNGVAFFKECFMTKLLMHPACLKTLSSKARTDEILSALQKITQTSFSQYESIIDQSISNENIRLQLKNTLKKRLDIFSKIYPELAEVVEPQNIINSLEAPHFCEYTLNNR